MKRRCFQDTAAISALSPPRETGTAAFNAPMHVRVHTHRGERHGAFCIGIRLHSAPFERANRVYCFEFRAPRLPINVREFRGFLAK